MTAQPLPVVTATASSSTVGGTFGFPAADETIPVKLPVDILGRKIVPNETPITDPAKQVHKKDAKLGPQESPNNVTSTPTAIAKAIADAKTGGNVGGHQILGSGDTKVQGTDWDTLGQIMQGYSGKANAADFASRQDFVDVQDKLFRGGFMNGKVPQKGQPDDTTQTALHDALILAARTGQTLDNVLDQAVASHPGAAMLKYTDVPGSTKRAGSPINLTNPQDIGDAISTSAPHLLGHAVSKDTINQIVAQYQALEASSQIASNAVQDSTQDGLVTQKPVLGSYVDNQLRQSDPGAAQGMAAGHYLSEFMQLLTSGGSGTSSTFSGATNNA